MTTTKAKPPFPGLRYPLASVTYGEEEIDAVLACLRMGQTTMGPHVAAFEARFAQAVGAGHAVMVNSGSTADMLAAFLLGPPKRGRSGYLDEVLVPAVTWPTQVWGCVLAGYRVRLVDTDPYTLQMDLHDLGAKLSRRTAAVFAVHVLGNVGDMDALTGLCRLHAVPLLEDCCEALGSTWRGRHVGTFGRAGAFSFFFSHLLSTMEGGMVVCPSPSDAGDLRLWRNHGWAPGADECDRFRFPTWGMNVRPTEVQGAFGIAQLHKTEGFIEHRRRNFGRLADATFRRYPDWLQGVSVLPWATPVWHGFPLSVRPDAPLSKRDLCRFLEGRGIATRPLIAGNLAKQPGVLTHERIVAGPLPGADAVDEHAFYIGLSSHEDEAGCAYVGQCFEDFFEGGRRA
jgi:CDP-6-deoxy-D-xylo-4-hexulose-3-dehydrase